MIMTLYFYIKDGRIEVTEELRSQPPDKVIKISNDLGLLTVKISFD